VDGPRGEGNRRRNQGEAAGWRLGTTMTGGSRLSAGRREGRRELGWQAELRLLGGWAERRDCGLC
jgi:hypothetical protein